jgi:hypothetical protein
MKLTSLPQSTAAQPSFKKSGLNPKYIADQLYAEFVYQLAHRIIVLSCNI